MPPVRIDFAAQQYTAACKRAGLVAGVSCIGGGIRSSAGCQGLGFGFAVCERTCVPDARGSCGVGVSAVKRSAGEVFVPKLFLVLFSPHACRVLLFAWRLDAGRAALD